MSTAPTTMRPIRRCASSPPQPRKPLVTDRRSDKRSEQDHHYTLRRFHHMAAPILSGRHLFTGVRGRCQPVEKVGVKLTATTNRTRTASKSAYLGPNMG